MDVAIGKGRPVMQNKQLSTLSRFLNLPVKPRLLPGFEHLRLARGKVCLHRKFRARQIKRLFVVLTHRRRATLRNIFRPRKRPAASHFPNQSATDLTKELLCEKILFPNPVSLIPALSLPLVFVRSACCWRYSVSRLRHRAER